MGEATVVVAGHNRNGNEQLPATGTVEEEQIDQSLTTATHLDCLRTENLSKKLTVEMVVEAGLSKGEGKVCCCSRIGKNESGGFSISAGPHVTTLTACAAPPLRRQADPHPTLVTGQSENSFMEEYFLKECELETMSLHFCSLMSNMYIVFPQPYLRS